MRTTCAIIDCSSTSYTNNSDGELRFHQFPKDAARCQAWIKACQRHDLLNRDFESIKYLNLCSLHFEKIMYAKKKLKMSAVPTLNLPPPNKSIGTQTESPKKTVLAKDLTQEDHALQIPENVTEHIPRKRKIGQTVAKHNKEAKRFKSKNKSISKQQFEIGCDIYLNQNLSSIVKAQINRKLRGKGQKYSKEFKLFALNMYFTSPQCYRFMAKTLCLPSKNTLSSMYIPMTTHINGHMYDALSTNAKLMTVSQRECVMCIDKISLKYSLAYNPKQDKVVGLHEVDGQQRPLAASFAFTIMLRGITSKWKQLIGFAFISSRQIDGQLADWILNTIKSLFMIGFQIRALVSDQASEFLQFAKTKGISKEQPYFDIDGKKIYYIFDVPHIVKRIRDSLIQNDFEYNGKTVSWDDIQMLYKVDVKKDVRSVPKLTDAHISPNNFQKHKVRFVTEVFSNSVVAALETYAATREITPASGTVEFIKTVDRLFDLRNSNNLHSDKPYDKLIRGDSSQIKLLDQAQYIFNNLKVKNKKSHKDVSNTDKFKNTLIITMNSIRQLLVDMQNDGYVYLLTRQLNNDCLEDFFELIRQAGGKCREPTCVQFTRTFRKSYIWQLMQLSEGRNCSTDFDSFLVKYDSFLINNSVEKNSKTVAKSNNKSLKLSYDLPEDNAFLYICGYVLRKCVQKHSCPAMRDYASSYTTEPTVSNLNERVENKTVDVLGVLQEVPDDFEEYCCKLEYVLKECFISFVGDNIGKRLYDTLKEIEFVQPCDCFPKQFLIELYVRMRIHYIIKFNKRRLNNSKIKSCKHLSVKSL